ncbi:hypothetical protein AGMMS50239_30530 [Bacteroidia bacterium]|nr:hypothetical protein AGMMS50239_30530 [Bacteroidia bacterium]
MKKKGKVSDYVKANRKGSREAEFEVSAGWTSKTKVHKSKKQYDRKGQNWKNDSDLFRFKIGTILPEHKFLFSTFRALYCRDYSNTSQNNDNSEVSHRFPAAIWRRWCQYISKIIDIYRLNKRLIIR